MERYSSAGGFKKILLLSFLFFLKQEFTLGADVVIKIPDNVDHDENATYRLDYSPPYGNPAPNTTVLAREIGSEIKFSNVLAGTMYEFRLYYSNSSVRDRTMYTASITTTPDPPANMLVSVVNGTSALVTFEPPRVGNWANFQLKLISLNESKPTRNVTLHSSGHYLLKDLTPGGMYVAQIFTVYDKKESAAYTQYKFTTIPNTPVKCIVWFRNETTLKLLWQPPSAQPGSIYTHYKVMIEPPDAPESVLLIEKGEPPGPANAVFKNLRPGRPYDISVQTVSSGQLSLPTSAQYRTTPLRPTNLQVDPSSITSGSFTVTWDPPDETTEFEKYQISINVRQPTPMPPVMRNKTEDRFLTFSERLQPGHTYQVTAMTVSGKVSSAKATTNVTLRPLPVKNLKVVLLEQTGQVQLTWKPNNASQQDSYEISYTEGSIPNGDTNFLISPKPEFVIESLLPGRNYTISVKAVSNNIQSTPVVAFQATRPSAPVIEDLKPIEYGLNISWKSDVNSRQEMYEILYRRNDTDSEPIKEVTKETHLLVENLYPGAGYNIRIFAISHGLKSEPHDYFQAVYPKPPVNLTKGNVTSNSVTLSWEKPKDSLFSEFSIWLKTAEETKWTKKSVERISVEISKLKPGERYSIQINSVSYGVESARPLILNHTVYPSPVSSIAPLVDSTNVTVEFPRPEGRIEYYVINWIALDEGVKKESRSMNKSDPLTNGKHVRILVDDLIPGVKYQFDIHTVSFGLQSNPTPFVARTMPLILSELVVVNSVQETNSMTIRYTPTPPSASHFDKYRFNLSDSNIMQEKSVNDTDWKVTFTNLVPGKLYNITVWTVSDNVLSQPLYKQDRLYPEPVSLIIAHNITESIITLLWDKPEGEFNFYEVQYLNAEGILVQNSLVEETCSVTNLKPYRNYTFTVRVVSGTENSYLRKSLPVTAVFQTQEGVPGMVSEFRPTDIHPRYITFEWELPDDEKNGVLMEFNIVYGRKGVSDVTMTSFKPQDFKGTIKDLIPGEIYQFKIQAKTIVGYGPEAVWVEEMPILAPPKPSSQIVPTEVCRTSSTIQIRFRKNYFSDINGPIIKYTIIVAEDDTKNTSGIEMPSWRDVQAYSIWPPYQALEPYNPFKNSTVEDYTIGAEEGCESKKDGYCNGPLKGGTVYRVKIRAFTTSKDFTDTDYSFAIQTDRSPLPLILGISLPSVFIFIVIIVIFTIRRYSVQKKKKSNKKDSDNMSLSDCIIETSRPVKLEKFPAYYEIMSADSDFRFSEEFEQLKNVGREQPCTAADLPCNRPKNRFTNILPYDHSRFKLQPVDDEEGSDYINANYIPGYNSPREFIVTQGPLPSTKDDFWRMCWESNSRAIVMLTKCVEKGREKCDHYWPEDTKRIFYGDISVTVLNENHFPNWCITELMVQRGSTQRVVRHFHFTTWPDFGVPNPPTILLKFVRAFRQKMSHEPRPIIVHCSAGVGRSGTFIAIDRILQSLTHATDYVDIFGIVYQMRKERAHMVQTEQQYICIHQCLLVVLQGQENQPPSRDEIHQNQAFEGEKQQTDSRISTSDSNDEEKLR